MYTLFDDSTVIKSADTMQELINERNLYIEKLLQEGFTCTKENYNDDDDIIELLPCNNKEYPSQNNEKRKITILWSGNITGNSKEYLLQNNNDDNKDNTSDTESIKEDINNKDDNKDDNKEDTKENKDNNKDDEDINNKIANQLINLLNSIEYQFITLPTAYTARQIFTMYNNEEFNYYRLFILKSMMQGKNECIININFTNNINLTNILAFCYMLIILGYKFEMTNDDKQLHIHIIW